MSWIEDRLPLLQMWSIGIGVMIGLPFLSYMITSCFQESFHYRLSWVLVANTDLAKGDRITRDRAELRLVYLKKNEDTTPAPFDWYAKNERLRKCVLLREDFSPAPSLEAPSDGAIVPISVKAEYTEGLKLGMRLSLKQNRTPVSQPVRDSDRQNVIGQGSGSQKSPDMPLPQPTNVSSSSQVTDSNQPAKQSLVGVLKSMVPSHDKKSTVLYVLVTGLGRDRLNELTLVDYVPFILPIVQNFSAPLGDDNRGVSAKQESPIICDPTIDGASATHSQDRSSSTPPTS